MAQICEDMGRYLILNASFSKGDTMSANHMKSSSKALRHLVVGAAISAFGLSFGLGTVALAQDWSAVELKSTDLGNGFHMIEGRGGNLGVSIGEDGVFLIDDQYAPLSQKISFRRKRSHVKSNSLNIQFEERFPEGRELDDGFFEMVLDLKVFVIFIHSLRVQLRWS